MAIRTLRPDKKGEVVLPQRTGDSKQTPHDILCSLELGTGGYATAPSTQTSRAVRETIRKKLRR